MTSLSLSIEHLRFAEAGREILEGEGKMLQICEFYGMKIYLYFDDHDPPHLHVRGQDKTRINILTGEYLEGDPPLPHKKEKKLREGLNKINLI